jgi:hypothetical protein
MPQIGDKVTTPLTKSVLEINYVSRDGSEVTLQLPGTNLQWFRVRTDTLTFVDRKPPAKTSNPFTNPEPVFDADEILERIATVKDENLKRLDDDIDILKAYLTRAAVLWAGAGRSFAFRCPLNPWPAHLRQRTHTLRISAKRREPSYRDLPRPACFQPQSDLRDLPSLTHSSATIPFPSSGLKRRVSCKVRWIR